MMNKKGILLVVSGFSGVGKGTVVKEMLRKYDNYALSISATTRAPRDGEEDGVSYFFKTKEEFEEMIAEQRFIEYARYVDNYYGTPKAYVEKQLEEGKDVILEIELQGAFRVKEQYPEAVLVFVAPPSADELERRLIGRNSEDAGTIAKRMARADEEACFMAKYEYIVINDEVESCVDSIHNIVKTMHTRTNDNLQYIADMQQQLKKYSKGDL